MNYNINAKSFIPNTNAKSFIPMENNVRETAPRPNFETAPRPNFETAPRPTKENTTTAATAAVSSVKEEKVKEEKVEKVVEKLEKVNIDNKISKTNTNIDKNISTPINIEDEKEKEIIKVAKKPPSDLKFHDEREHLNVVFIGHVDAGKSTTCGNILVLTNTVDERTIAKYEREAKDKNRESWYLAYVMDTNDEERAKGKTVEVGRAHFNSAVKRYTILDAPGHKNYVPNMVVGAAQADIGVLIISARKGEFETGFDKGGQTREHAMLAKTLGVSTLIVAVNKMDDPTVSWDKARY